MITSISKQLKLPLSSQILIGLGVAQAVDEKTGAEGIKFLKTKLDLPDYQASDEIVLHPFFSFVQTESVFSAKQRQQLMQSIMRLNPGAAHSALAPLMVDTVAVDSKLDSSGETSLQGHLSQPNALARPADLLQVSSCL